MLLTIFFSASVCTHSLLLTLQRAERSLHPWHLVVMCMRRRREDKAIHSINLKILLKSLSPSTPACWAPACSTNALLLRQGKHHPDSTSESHFNWLKTHPRRWCVLEDSGPVVLLFLAFAGHISTIFLWKQEYSMRSAVLLTRRKRAGVPWQLVSLWKSRTSRWCAEHCYILSTSFYFLWFD